MTFENRNKLLFTASLAVAFAVALVGSENAFAAHSDGQWTDPNQDYYCTYEVTTKLDVTANISECADLSTSAAHWNNISNQDFTLTQNTSSSSTNMNIWTHAYGSTGYIAAVYNAAGYPMTEGNVYMKISEDRTFGDVSAGDTNVFDYETVTTHEFGHVAGLEHNSNLQSVLYWSISIDQDRPYPNWHDRQEMRTLYP